MSVALIEVADICSRIYIIFYVIFILFYTLFYILFHTFSYILFCILLQRLLRRFNRLLFSSFVDYLPDRFFNKYILK